MYKFFNSKVILITGGTGSFGKAALKKILLNSKPKKLIVYSRDELKQFEMQQNIFFKKYKSLRYFVGDVRDLERLKLATKDVDIIIHAAALKQILTAEYNPMEAIKTNILGSQNIIDASLYNETVKKVIALSTDKAVDPLNLYGATKLAADKLFVAANNLAGKRNLKFSIVRYGNVVGSRGSVVPLFEELIQKKSKYLPVTDKKMTRFWITLDEATNFVLNCFDLMKGGEIFIPKMASVRIVDLASAMKKNQKIKFVGIRAGEKIHEILCPTNIAQNLLEFKNYYLIKPFIDLPASNYIINPKGEKGKKVKNNFQYSSDTNKNFLNFRKIIETNKKINKIK